MKKRNTLTLILLLAALTLAAQSNYSPCYTNNMSKGNTAFSQGKYSEARTYYVNAKQCAGGNPTEAQKKINACDAKIKAQKEAAEAKRRAEEERIANNEQAEIQKLKSACPPTLKDYDGNVYNTVFIGKQCWMRENLRTTHYSNGIGISIGDGISPTIAYRYCPYNKCSNVSNYGYLYNWAAVMHGSLSSNRNPSRVQGVCPNGWHIPSYAEWIQLKKHVESQSKYQCSGDSKNIAKSLASSLEWQDCGIPCSVGNNISSNNETGFSALPAGTYFRAYSSYPTVHFWTSTEDAETSAYSFSISYNESFVSFTMGHTGWGYSVRCIKD